MVQRCRRMSWSSTLLPLSVVLLVLFSAPGPAGSQSPLVVGPGVIPLDYRAAQSEIDPGAEDELLALLNQVRAEYHLPPLVMDPMLRAAARAHSRDMALHGYFGHSSPWGQSFVDRLAAVVRGGTLVGENVAVAASAESAEAAFLASPGHFRNMVEPAFHRVGIGVATAGELGVMVTEDFSE
jgi:uncharacterized protein YkwD